MNPAPLPKDPRVRIVWDHLQQARAQLGDHFPFGVSEGPEHKISAEDQRWIQLINWLDSDAKHDLREIDAISDD